MVKANPHVCSQSRYNGNDSVATGILAGFERLHDKQQPFKKMQNPRPQHWTNVAIGRSYFDISATVNSRDKSINIWLNINGENAKENFDKLKEVACDNSLKQIHDNLVWDRIESEKQCAVKLKTNGDFTDRSDWNRPFAWF